MLSQVRIIIPYTLNTCSGIFWLMIQLFLSICREAQVRMLIIVLDVAVTFQGKEWELNSPSDGTACAETQTLCYLRWCIPVFGKNYFWGLFLVNPGLREPCLFSPCRLQLIIFRAVMKTYLSKIEVCQHFKLNQLLWF